jgi:hypothetical protein
VGQPGTRSKPFSLPTRLATGGSTGRSSPVRSPRPAFRFVAARRPAPMNLLQRIIVCLGCNALVWILLHPPLYQAHADGTRLEHSLEFIWNAPLEWSINVPLSALRVAIVVLVTAGFAFAFKTNPPREGQK